MCAAVSADVNTSCISVESAVFGLCLTKYIHIEIMVTVSEKTAFCILTSI